MCVCIMFIHSHVSDDYLLKELTLELTIPCNLPSKITFVRHIHLYSISRARKQNTEYKSNTFQNEKKLNDRETKKQQEENYV